MSLYDIWQWIIHTNVFVLLGVLILIPITLVMVWYAIFAGAAVVAVVRPFLGVLGSVLGVWVFLSIAISLTRGDGSGLIASWIGTVGFIGLLAYTARNLYRAARAGKLWAHMRER